MHNQIRTKRKLSLFRSPSSVIVATFALGMMLLPLAPSTFAAKPDGSEKGDVKRGQDVFEKRCIGCHSLDVDKEGPRLRGVYGKKAATLSATYEYSDALKASNVTWDDASLNQWMDDAEKIVPNSNMFFRVPKASERADVIAYLQQLPAQ